MRELRKASLGNLIKFVDNQPISLFDLLGLLSRDEAEKLLKEYNLVDYKTKSSTQVYEFVGGWLQTANATPGNLDYTNSCALRLSVAWSRFGVNLKGESGAVNIGTTGHSENLGGKKHVIISAKKMVSFLGKKLGQAHYQNETEYKKNQKSGDILIWGDSGHTGMAPCDDIKVGSYITGPIWVFPKAQ